MNLAELFGFIGGGVGMFFGIPQALNLRKAGSSDGVNFIAWVLVFGVSTSWAAYGFTISSPSVFLTNLGGALVNGSVVAALINNKSKSLPLIAGLVLFIWGLVLLLPATIVNAILIALVFAQAPQIRDSYQSFKSKSPSVVSLPSLRVAAFAMSCWGIYAVLADVQLILLTTVIALSINITIQILETLNKRQLVQAS